MWNRRICWVKILRLLENNVYLDVIQQQSNKPYYIPKKEEILCLGKYNHQNITDELRKIYAYLMDNMDITNDIAIDACYQMQINMRFGCEIQEIINKLTGLGAKFKKEKQLKDFTGLLMKTVCQPLAINIPGRFENMFCQLRVLSANQADR